MVESTPRRPNLITVVLDCVRAKSLAIGGGTRVARTPTIDALARRGTVFPRAVAPSNWTVPSHMSMMTGAYPNRHLLRTFHKGAPRLPTLASWLSAQGYETALFSEQVHLVAGYGLESGFEYCLSSADRAKTRTEDRNAARELFSHSDFLYTPAVRRMIEAVPPSVLPISAVSYPQEMAYKARVCTDRIASGFDRWVQARSRERPFHAFINFVNGHEPYGIRGPGTGVISRWYARTPRYYLLSVPGLQRSVRWTEAESGYLRAIEEADRKVARLMTSLEQAGELDRTYFLLTSDHGQSFGERGHVFHGNGAVDSVTRVPMLLVPPPGVSLPHRVDRWTSLCETYAWWRAIASGRMPLDDRGVSTMPPAETADATDAVYCEGSPASDSNRSLRDVGTDRIWNHRLLAAYLPDSKLVLDTTLGTIDRWDLQGDPDDKEPERLAPSDAERVRERIFSTYLSTEPNGPDPRLLEMDASVDERLRSWGYD